MKLFLRLAIGFTLAPPLLAVLGIVLSHALGCSGMDHIETCAVPGALRYVAPLIALVWVSVFTVPAGLMAIVVALAVRWLGRRASSDSVKGRLPP